MAPGADDPSRLPGSAAAVTVNLATNSASGVTDIRNLGLAGGIDLEPRAGKPGERGYDTFVKAFELGVLVPFSLSRAV